MALLNPPIRPFTTTSTAEIDTFQEPASDPRVPFSFQDAKELLRWQTYQDSVKPFSVPATLKAQTLTAPTPEALEEKFVAKYGAPAALIEDNKKDRFLLKMADGSYWEYPQNSEAGGKKSAWIIRKITSAEGEAIEINVGNAMLEYLDFQFTTNPRMRLVLKTTMSLPSVGTLDEDASPTKPYIFASRHYNRANKNTAVGYAAGAKPNYYLAQPQNGCVAAGILNGALFSGVLPHPDNELLMEFYSKLRKMQNSPSGRIFIEQLGVDIQDGKIPGLTISRVELTELADAVTHKNPVLALVPFFSGHAVAVVGVDEANRTYRAIDTVSGMEVQLSFASHLADREIPSSARPTTDDEDKRDKALITQKVTTLLQGNTDPHKIAALIKELEDPTKLATARSILLELDPPGERSPFFGNEFYSFRITDLKQFIDWVNTPNK